MQSKPFTAKDAKGRWWSFWVKDVVSGHDFRACGKRAPESGLCQGTSLLVPWSFYISNHDFMGLSPRRGRLTVAQHDSALSGAESNAGLGSKPSEFR
jgi:hypothetical protein